MSGLLSSVKDFITSLNLTEKLSPKKNNEIIWFYLFLPSFVVYLVFLSSYLNEKPPIGSIEVFDKKFGQVISPSARIEIIAHGLNWTEGPLWMSHDSMPLLVFSDTVLNRIYKWEEGKGMFTIGKTIYVENSGCKFDSTQCVDMYEPGSNGLLRRNDDSFDIIACTHGDRGISLIRENGTRSMVVTHYKSSRLNSPNDLVLSPEGHLYFTDPNYGLHSKEDSSVLLRKELHHAGVYMVKGDYLRLALETGEPTAYVRLVEGKLSHPNGLAFSPDFAKLYISNSNAENSFINVYDVADDGSLKHGKVFFNATQWATQQCLAEANHVCLSNDLAPVDGMKVDIHGNVITSGPGGVLVLSPEGDVLGRLHFDRPVSNVAFGGDGRLYITAKDIVARVYIKTKPSRIVGKLNL